MERVRYLRRKYGLLIILIVMAALVFVVGFLLGRTTAKAEADGEYLVLNEDEDDGYTIILNWSDIPTYYDVPLSEDMQDVIFQCAEDYDLPVALILAVIEIESKFDADAISATDDYGLMQINGVNLPDIRAEFGDIDLLDPADNIRAGCWLLRADIDAAGGDIAKGLMVYNMGLSGAMALWEAGITENTYSEKVMEAMDGYE